MPDTPPIPTEAPPPQEQATQPRAERSRHRYEHEVTFVSYPKLVFTWPIILAGLLFWPLATWGWVSPATLGWIYIWVTLAVLLVLAIDVNIYQFIFVVVALALVWALGQFVVEDFFSALSKLGLQYDPGFGLVLSILLAIPFLIMIFVARFNDYWRITHNEFEHYRFGRASDSLGRGAKSIRVDYTDILEFFVGMAGTLIVYNATGSKELRRIPHVVGLPFIKRKLNRVLERTLITSGYEEYEDEDEEG